MAENKLVVAINIQHLTLGITCVENFGYNICVNYEVLVQPSYLTISVALPSYPTFLYFRPIPRFTYRNAGYKKLTFHFVLN